jgi:hypothetical protein
MDLSIPAVKRNVGVVEPIAFAVGEDESEGIKSFGWPIG